MGSRAAGEYDTMVSFSTLDLLLLTFNCGKSPIDVPVFAARLQDALSPNRTGSALPDVVVFSLQEVAPLGHAFVGSYFLLPYLARFDEALNRAASLLDGYGSEATPSDGRGGAGEDEDGDGIEVQASAAATAAATQMPLVERPSLSSSSNSSLVEAQKKKPYQLVRQANVGMTAVLLFARDAGAVRNVEVAECGFGVADMGNKGAVGLRVAYRKPGGSEGEGDDDNENDASELTFVATHLAAMEWNVRRRNANWRSIVAGLTFGNPRDAISATDAHNANPSGSSLQLGRGRQGRTHDEAASAPQSPEEEAEADAADAAGDDAWLLLGQQGEGVSSSGSSGSADGPGGPGDHSSATTTLDIRRRLHEMSIFRPDSLLFVAGDLNYRIGAERPQPGAVFPTADAWSAFLERDQLSQERQAGRTFHGMHEAAIAFPPTYKYVVLEEGPEVEAEAQNAAEIRAWRQAHNDSSSSSTDDVSAATRPVPWKYASHRWPSWCDRVLYLDVSAAAKRRWQQKSGGSSSSSGIGPEPKVEVTTYMSLPLMRTSDHQPVFLRAQVPLLGGRGIREEGRDDGGEIANGENENEGENHENHDLRDPRIHLPVPIDTDAWERRAQARRREFLAGCGMLLFNTRGGAIAMATAVVVIVGAYWVWAGMVV